MAFTNELSDIVEISFGNTGAETKEAGRDQPSRLWQQGVSLVSQIIYRAAGCAPECKILWKETV